VIVLTIISLLLTGYRMRSPYIVGVGRTAYVMGTMRFVHILSVYGFIFGVALRIAWFFLGNRLSHINQYFPTTGKRWNDLLAIGKYYAFMAWSPVSYIGHNPLAGAAYLAVDAIAIVEILTVFALFSLVVHSPVLSFFIGWLPRLIDVQWLQETHFLIMFCFWMFLIHHIYTAILVSVEEENGLMDSIFSGYKFIPKRLLAREMMEPGSPPELSQTQRPPPLPEAELDVHARAPI
jgi:Ni/Fe-hydrogenase 1 B-type cytochrome subunit